MGMLEWGKEERKKALQDMETRKKNKELRLKREMSDETMEFCFQLK